MYVFITPHYIYHEFPAFFCINLRSFSTSQNPFPRQIVVARKSCKGCGGEGGWITNQVIWWISVLLAVMSGEGRYWFPSSTEQHCNRREQT